MSMRPPLWHHRLPMTDPLLDHAGLAAENAALKARVAALEARIEELQRLADSDPLTPLPNRRHFLRAVSACVARVARHGTPAALLFVDVDGLKAINDAHGHGAGDEVLVHIAWLLRQRVRGSDVVARIGGDEFGVLLEHVPPAAAVEKARLLADAVAAHPVRDIPVAVSIGVAPLGPDDTAEAALARADGAMYRVKRAGPDVRSDNSGRSR
jgi:diguanylate cyclase (GGDEF)-like protein